MESKQDYLAKLQVAVSHLHKCGAAHVRHTGNDSLFSFDDFRRTVSAGGIFVEVDE